MTARCVFASGLLFILVSCATVSSDPVRDGLDLVNAGDFSAGLAKFNECASHGDPRCVFALGAFYDSPPQGFRRDINTAVAFYTLAARFGLPAAQQRLAALNRPIPYPDLMMIRKAQAQEEARQREAAWDSLIDSVSHRQVFIVQPQPRPNTSRTDAFPSCRSDADCSGTTRCLRPAGTYGAGTCVEPRDSIGGYVLLPAEVGPHEVAGCTFTTDCAIGFACVKSSNQLKGLCVKQ